MKPREVLAQRFERAAEGRAQDYVAALHLLAQGCPPLRQAQGRL
jgi:hypothetical protein